MPTTYFGCAKCAIYHPTLDLALQHLRRSPVHHTDTLELIEKFDSGYRAVAARTLLFSFSTNTPLSHDAAIETAELQASAAKAGVEAALRTRRAIRGRDEDEDDVSQGAPKHPCLAPPYSCVDVCPPSPSRITS